MRDRGVNVSFYITNPLLLSIPHKFNLGGTLRTIYDAQVVLS